MQNTINFDNLQIGEDEKGGYLKFKSNEDENIVIPKIEQLFGVKLEKENKNYNNYAYYRYSKFLGNRLQQVGKYTDNTPYSIMHVFGMGDGIDKQMVNAGRIIKGKRDFIIEMKAGENLYCGLQLRGNYNNEKSGTGEIYTSNYSKIQAVIDHDTADEPVTHDTDVYTEISGCGE